MNLQQVAQPRSANGFSRRRGKTETGTRADSKSQAGKSNFNQMINAGSQTEYKGGVVDSSSRDRLVYLTSCLIGHQVEVQVVDGSVFSGIFHATNAEKDFGIILKMARVIKGDPSRAYKDVLGFVNKPPSRTLIIPANDLVQIVAKSVSVSVDELTNDLQHENQQDIMTDSSISQSRHVQLERELEPWVPDDDNPESSELDNTFDRHWNRGWDQFEANAALFGVKSTFDEELYTTKLDRGPQMRELEREALRIAREIEGEDTQDLHLAEERGIPFHDRCDLDEETKYSSVFRGVDDSGYDENEDIWDSENIETFGDVSDSVMNKSLTKLTSRISRDVYLSGSLDGERSPNCLGTQDNLINEHGGSHYAKDDTEKHMLFEQNQVSNEKDTESSHEGKKESSDKGLLVDATAYAPSNVSSTAQENTSSGEAPGGAATFKMHEAAEPAVSRAAATSEYGNSASATPGLGLSPSSSVGSLTSEKSTLNPQAKEFRLNPNAKSFVPLPTSLRPVSPVSDGSFYYPANVAPVPHMNGIGMGQGASFTPHQPVMFGPQSTSMPSQQVYFHSNGPQYGQQMLLGQPRQVLYMPSYPPETPYKGRDF